MTRKSRHAPCRSVRQHMHAIENASFHDPTFVIWRRANFRQMGTIPCLDRKTLDLLRQSQLLSGNLKGNLERHGFILMITNPLNAQNSSTPLADLAAVFDDAYCNSPVSET